MHISINLPVASRDLEQSVFAFTNLLSRYCAAIEACDIVVESPIADDGVPTFIVKATLRVFGEHLHLVGTASGARPEYALKNALDRVSEKARARLAPIAREHSGCGCDSCA